jgi:HEAT repeat protein
MLVHLGQPAKEDLIQALEDRNPLIRQQSARILGQIGDESADKPLTKLLQDSNANVRRAAQEALNQLKS